MKVVDELKFDSSGLIPAIVQEAATGRVLMMAWMNRESLQKTLELGEMVYWSRSRQELWHKGATSGHTQKVLDLAFDCDKDALLAQVILIGLVEQDRVKPLPTVANNVGKGESEVDEDQVANDSNGADGLVFHTVLDGQSSPQVAYLHTLIPRLVGSLVNNGRFSPRPFPAKRCRMGQPTLLHCSQLCRIIQYI